jgi:Mg2+ and Co2+ transporter CorA
MNDPTPSRQATPAACAHIVLYAADGSDRDLAIDEIALPSSDAALLWIDIDCDAPELVADVCGRLELPRSSCSNLVELSAAPLLRLYGDRLVVQVAAVEHAGGLKFEGTVLAIAAGPNFVLTVHHKPIDFIPSIRKREHGETRLGMLSAPSFVASLLDWQLGTYFEAVSAFERAAERLEESILADRRDESDTAELRQLRRGASRLRRMLAPHRALFSSLARPDFRPDDDEETLRHFQRLDEHFERAMDIVEDARELVVGSFELFSNQIAVRTNASMRLLTFATVVIGLQTVIAGALGMNFKAGFFDTAGLGFWLAVAGMALVTAVAAWIGRRKRWF